MLPFLDYFYSLTVRFIKAASGMQRFSVLEALNAMTKEVVTITDRGYINAVCVGELLQKMHDLFGHLSNVLIIDNARYQRCAFVEETARKLGIQLIFLPPYSPNLNLIEWLWKFVKKKALYNQYYAHYKQFHTSIGSVVLLTKKWATLGKHAQISKKRETSVMATESFREEPPNKVCAQIHNTPRTLITRCVIYLMDNINKVRTIFSAKTLFGRGIRGETRIF